MSLRHLKPMLNVKKVKPFQLLCEEERLDAIKLTGLLENYFHRCTPAGKDQVAETSATKNSGT